MKKLTWISSALLAGCLVTACSALYAQNGPEAQAIVTVMPKKGTQEPPVVTESQIQATLDNKRTTVTSWIPLRGERAGVQIMLVIDDGARSAVSLQFNDLKNFIQRLPEI